MAHLCQCRMNFPQKWALPQFRCNFLNPVDSTCESAGAWKMAKRILPLIPSSLVVDHVQQSRAAISIDCHCRSIGARCPDCCRVSHRVHSQYQRYLADLPWQGRAVTIILHVRRLRCDNENCRRRIFAENVGDVTWSYCRRTRRLGDVHCSIGLALGGRGGHEIGHSAWHACERRYHSADRSGRSFWGL